ncbi:MAG: hypothetical protein F6J98_34520 [Moorea sp. SIO4G2]|nr:hypothetical protein [Moorena sp. SIO4G2]
MRYTLFFPSSLFPLPSSLFPLHSSLLPAPCSVRVAWPTASVPKNQRFVPHGYKTCYKCYKSFELIKFLLTNP